MSVSILMQEAVQKTLSDVQADLSYVDQVLWNLDAERRDDFKTWLSENEISVVQGWNGNPTELPVIAFTIDAEEEIDPSINMGGFGEIIGGDWRDTYQIALRGTYLALIVSYNADITEYLSRLVKWGLLRERINLEDGSGLYQQQVGMKAFLPNTNYAPDTMVFGRAVTFSCTSYEVYSITDTSGVLGDVELGTITEEHTQKPLYP